MAKKRKTKKTAKKETKSPVSGLKLDNQTLGIIGVIVIGIIIIAITMGQQPPTPTPEPTPAPTQNEPAVPEEYCTKRGTQTSMSLSDAIKIARASECNQGELTDVYMCNSITGTWWINLNLEKEGCNPACVIDVVTKQAEINWRCTGAIP